MGSPSTTLTASPGLELSFFLVAGETSGDLHGAQLIRALKAHHPRSGFTGHGGDAMATEGMRILEHVDDLAMMGFTEVLKHIPHMMKIMDNTVKTIQELRPDRVVLIDYPGFNLRLAKKIHGLGIPVTYFILPQIWAWRERRVSILRKNVDQALCIFPFEQDWFTARGLNAQYMGHPFVEMAPLSGDYQTITDKHDFSSDDPILVLLPGSRQQEVDKHWSLFLGTVDLLRKKEPALQVLVGKAPAVSLSPLPADYRIENDSRIAMWIGTAAIVASGTATLEAAVMDIPLVVCYRLSRPSWWLAKRMARVTHVSMVNLIAEREIVPEFLQDDMTPSNLAKALRPLLNKRSPERKEMLSGFDEVRRTLGAPGVYDRAAEAILTRTRDQGTRVGGERIKDQDQK